MLHIFVVSLEKDIERRMNISKKLDSFNLKYTFIDAIYGKNLDKIEIESLRSRSVGHIINRGFLPTAGEIGCSLSHIKVYKKIIEDNLDWACILEDDVILDEKFNKFIKNFKSDDLKSDSIYLLGGPSEYSKSKIIKSYKNKITIGDQLFVRTIKSEEFIWSTCCYLISNDLAKQRIDVQDKNFIVADDWKYLVENKIIKSVYLSDFVIHPEDLKDSNIEKERETSSKNTYITKINFFQRAKISLDYRLRPVYSRIYKVLEKNES